MNHSSAASLTLQIVFVEKQVKACRSTIYIHLSLELDVMSDWGTSAGGRQEE